MSQRVPIGENKANAIPEAENPARKLLQKEKWVEEQPTALGSQRNTL